MRLNNLLKVPYHYSKNLQPVSFFFASNAEGNTPLFVDSSHFCFQIDLPSYYAAPSAQKLFIGNTILPGFPVFSSSFRVNENLILTGRFSSIPFRNDNILLEGTGIRILQEIKTAFLIFKFSAMDLKGPDDFRFNLFSYGIEYMTGFFGGNVICGISYFSFQYRFREIFPKRQFDQNMIIPHIGYSGKTKNHLFYSVKTGSILNIWSLVFSGGFLLP